MSLSKEETNLIIDKYYNEISSFCVFGSGNVQDGEDIAQSVFILLLEKAKELKNNQIRAWLYSVSSLKIKEYFRQKQKERSFISYEECDDIEIPDPTEQIVKDFEKLLNNTQKRILSKLNEKEKAVFVKRFIEKKNLDEVAAEMNETKNYVSVQSFRAKKKAEEIIKTTQLLISETNFKLM